MTGFHTPLGSDTGGNDAVGEEGAIGGASTMVKFIAAFAGVKVRKVRAW